MCKFWNEQSLLNNPLPWGPYPALHNVSQSVQGTALTFSPRQLRESTISHLFPKYILTKIKHRLEKGCGGQPMDIWKGSMTMVRREKFHSGKMIPFINNSRARLDPAFA